MDTKSSLLTVIEDAAEHEFKKMNLDHGSYDSDIQQLSPPSISSASEDSEMEDDFGSNNCDDNLDLAADSENGDPNQTLEAANINKSEIKSESTEKDEFRGRPSSCVFVASLASSKTDDELSISVTNHFEQVSTRKV